MTKRITVQIDEDTEVYLKKLAATHKRSVSWVVNEFIIRGRREMERKIKVIDREEVILNVMDTARRISNVIYDPRANK